VVYAASGTGPYAFTFEILNQTDIAVYKASTLLTLTTDYTVTINANGTGSVTLVTSAGTSNITIVGAKNIQRTSDYTTGGDLFASTINTDLDSLTIFSQQVAETAERGLKAPVTDPTDIAMTLPAKDGRKGKVLAFDSTTGNPVAGPALDAVTTVIEQSANINTVAANITSVNTVASNTSNINTVAGVSSNVTTVATNITNVNAVGSDLLEPVSEINTVAVNIDNVNTVGTNITAVNTNATNITAIQNASTNATNAASSASAASTSASNASTSETNAANSATSANNAKTAAEAARDATLAAYDNFDDRYLGSKTSDPTLDNDGNALLAGSLYFNSVSGVMRLYTGSAWVAAYVQGVASSISVTPAGNIAATNVQTALQELDSDKVAKTSDTGSAVLPKGTTAQRDGTPLSGYLRYNTTTGAAEIYNGSAWSSVGGGATGAGGDTVFQENSRTVTTNYTLTSGKSASCVGPITVNSGVSLTVPSGERLVIL